MKSHQNVRVWAAPVIALIGFVLLAGCGGGGNSGGNPTAMPSPTSSPLVTEVLARASYSSVDGYAIATVTVQWPQPSFVSSRDVVEYHIYRNNVIVGTASKQTFLLADAGTMPSFSYYAISANDDTRLNPTTASATPAFAGGIMYTYRVTALYVTPESASAATPVYAETEIGRSDSITPYPFTAGSL